MKKLSLLIVGLFLIATTGIASATNYNFNDLIDDWEILGFDSDAALIVQGYPLNYTHDITGQVDFGAGDYVTSATLELDFTNDCSDDIGSEQVGPRWWPYTIYWNNEENASYGFDENGWTLIGEVDNGQYDIIVNVDWLNDDGILDVALSVSNPLGTATAWLDHSRLYGTAETAPVPEPATLLLLGCGLLGIAGVSRKK